MYHRYPNPSEMYTLQGTNISLSKAVLKMIFLFPRWDMLIPWRVIINQFVKFVHVILARGLVRNINLSFPDPRQCGTHSCGHSGDGTKVRANGFFVGN